MSLTFTIQGGGEIVLDDFRGIVAGYTGRDQAAVQHHIDELAAIGVAPPPEVPMFYEVDPATVSTAADFEDSATNLTSGEVEPVYIRHDGVYYLGVGSDHTDRDVEREDIGDSKRACPKPVGGEVIRVDDFAGLRLDDATARCTRDGVLYQEGLLSGLLSPADVVERLIASLGLAPDADFVCLGGTLPLIDGGFKAGEKWQVQIEFPNGPTLTHDYRMKGNEER